MRQNGFAFVIPGRGIALVNMTHVETPLEPLAMARKPARGQGAGRPCRRLPQRRISGGFGNARVRAYGNPASARPAGSSAATSSPSMKCATARKFDDAVGRTAWPIELHDTPQGYVWQTFPEITALRPARQPVPAEGDNMVAAGRCIDADLRRSPACA